MTDRLDVVLGKMSERLFGNPDFTSVVVDPDPEPEPKKELTPEEEWPRLLERLQVPPAYRSVPRSLALPSKLTGWRGDPWAIFLRGPTGCGKTWLAIRMLAEFAEAMPTKSLRNFPMFADAAYALARIQDEMRSDDPNKTMRQLLSAPALLLDDLGAERGTDYQADKLNLVLRVRHLEQLPTIITSNVKNVNDATVPAIASRLAAGVFPVSGSDRRL